MFELLAPLGRHTQHYSHHQQREHREESRVEGDPEVLGDALPEERSLDVLLRGTQVVEEGIEGELESEGEVEEGEPHWAGVEERGERHQIVDLVVGAQLVLDHLLEGAAAPLLLL